MHQLVPIRVTALGHVGAKGGEKIERMGRARVPSPPARAAAAAPPWRCRTCRASVAFERIEPREFAAFGQGRMVGDVVGGAREAVEAQDVRAQPRRNQQRGDGKVLAVLGLARIEIGRDASSLRCKRLTASLPCPTPAPPMLERRIQRERQIGRSDQAERLRPTAPIRDRNAGSAKRLASSRPKPALRQHWPETAQKWRESAPRDRSKPCRKAVREKQDGE